jgi:polyhydroxyalkanoate depolymerase
MSMFPPMQSALEALRLNAKARAETLRGLSRAYSLGYELCRTNMDIGLQTVRSVSSLLFPWWREECDLMTEYCSSAAHTMLETGRDNLVGELDRMYQTRMGEADFLHLLSEDPPKQDWSFEYDESRIILDLPSMRLIDLSEDTEHEIFNYTVVFAPRAGHHSNIAERAALFMRDHGLTRLAVVEQKCAEDVPLYVGGTLHHEDFAGQVEQYRRILECLKERTGYPSHLVAICQPGPLLMGTLILYPHLGKTFGCAGSPMHTEGEDGVLTDFARTMGGEFMDLMVDVCGRVVDEDSPGAGRRIYDGRMQVFGFYLLGMQQHLRNLRQLLQDLREGNEESAQRQWTFYEWYNTVNHTPDDFIRDTFKKVFVNNDLIKGQLQIGDRQIGIGDYPASVPAWALGGSKDEITPPRQATGHMEYLSHVPPEDRMTLICEGGHMGLFRSSRVLKNYYTRIVDFLLRRSDRMTEELEGSEQMAEEISQD